MLKSIAPGFMSRSGDCQGWRGNKTENKQVFGKAIHD